MENDSDKGKHPSADKLYAIAKALAVAMSDLLGRPIITDPVAKRPAALLAFAKQAKLPQADVEMLARIQFRGEPPKTQERWEFIYPEESPAASSRSSRAGPELRGARPEWTWPLLP